MWAAFDRVGLMAEVAEDTVDLDIEEIELEQEKLALRRQELALKERKLAVLRQRKGGGICILHALESLKCSDSSRNIKTMQRVVTSACCHTLRVTACLCFARAACSAFHHRVYALAHFARLALGFRPASLHSCGAPFVQPPPPPPPPQNSPQALINGAGRREVEMCAPFERDWPHTHNMGARRKCRNTSERKRRLRLWPFR